MIPADIKEMAKHDPLVAELLAAGGPFLYKEWQLLRNGKARAMAYSRYRKARIGVWALSLVSAAYFVALVALWISWVDKHPGEAMLRAFNGMMYLAFCGYLFKRMRMLRELVRRIDAGEFSAD